VPKIVSWKRLVKIGSRRLDRNALREILGRFLLQREGEKHENSACRRFAL
jgi:hypothetical protein